MVVKFDISQIPSNADVIEATYSMFFFWGDTAQQGDPNVCSLFTISKQWIDTEVTWHNADSNTAWEDTDPDTKFFNPLVGDTMESPGGCDFSRNNIVVADYADTCSWENYDVTDMVKEMHANQIANYGFMIKQFVCIKTAQGKDPKLRYNWGKSYRSSEYEEVEIRPKLTVKYETTGINTYHTANFFKSKIVTINIANALKIHIPFEDSYHVSINDLKGRELLSYEGKGERWIALPTTITRGMFLIKVDIKEKSIMTRLFLVQ